ncbi:MAG: hypothetical protein UU47_C0003G0013 [candidate division TM6 bacterium GW2011_GWE2_41_16]|nr:MAG: hypothetical protein UU47_C0003G0013 [candidate division TM6 bacterium GW2011_GWE2_41_16]
MINTQYLCKKVVLQWCICVCFATIAMPTILHGMEQCDESGACIQQKAPEQSEPVWVTITIRSRTRTELPSYLGNGKIEFLTSMKNMIADIHDKLHSIPHLSITGQLLQSFVKNAIEQCDEATQHAQNFDSVSFDESPVPTNVLLKLLIE